jgi:hypothetical protein
MKERLVHPFADEVLARLEQVYLSFDSSMPAIFLPPSVKIESAEVDNDMVVGDAATPAGVPGATENVVTPATTTPSREEKKQAKAAKKEAKAAKKSAKKEKKERKRKPSLEPTSGSSSKKARTSLIIKQDTKDTE